MRMPQRFVTLGAALLAGSGAFFTASIAEGQPLRSILVPAHVAQSAAPVGSASPRALLDRYCVGCHNEKAKIAGLMLDHADLNDVTADAQTWEKVIRKLRTGAMPPAGRPRPDKAGSDGLAASLESQLDRDAALRPNPGRTEAIHRLNRAEYRNAI